MKGRKRERAWQNGKQGKREKGREGGKERREEGGLKKNKESARKGVADGERKEGKIRSEDRKRTNEKGGAEDPNESFCSPKEVCVKKKKEEKKSE